MKKTEYMLADLLDMPLIQKLADSIYLACGLPMALVDTGTTEIIAMAGRTDICNNFHRANPFSIEMCLESDRYINDHISDGPSSRYRCKNGMWHIAMPILVGNDHLGTLFLSQFFFKDDIPNREFFISQAEKYGYDTDKYLEALDRVPAFDKEQIDYVVSYDLALVRFIADLAEHSIEAINARESLRKSEDRFRRLIESVTDYIYTVIVKNGRAVSTTHRPGCIAITGYSAEEYQANPDLWYQMVHNEDRTLVLDQLTRTLAGEKVSPLEHRIIHKNGSIRWIRNTIVQLLDEDNKLVAYDGMITDITERKSAELALREGEERYRSFLEDFQGVAFKRTVDLKPIFFHGAVEKITGYTEEDFMTTVHWRKVVHPDDIQSIYENMKDLQTIPGHSVEREYRILRKDGQLRWIKELIQNKCDDAGKPAFIQGTIYDITERKKLEEQLQHAQRTEAIGQLAGGVAHDFNNILSAVIGFTTLAQMKMGADDPSHKYLSKIFELSDRAAKLTNSLLTFSRKQEINVRALDLNKIMSNTGMLLARIIGEDIKLEIDLAASPITIMSDSGQLEQIMMNLASNSRDSMPNGGTLKINTSVVTMDQEFIKTNGYGKPGRYAVIQVADSGFGMDEKIRDKIFDPFFTTKEVGKGTGLGLAIVYGIVKQHNGYINVYCETEKGTTFKIYLPALPEPAEDVTKPECPVKGGVETILIAEDERAARESLKGMLEEYGYAVIEARDGQDAVDKFSANRHIISLVFLDVIMPVKSGKAAYDEIKAISPEMKVIFTSGYTGDMLQGKGVVNNGSNFVAKPVDPKELFKKIRQVLDTK